MSCHVVSCCAVSMIQDYYIVFCKCFTLYNNQISCVVSCHAISLSFPSLWSIWGSCEPTRHYLIIVRSHCYYFTSSFFLYFHMFYKWILSFRNLILKLSDIFVYMGFGTSKIAKIGFWLFLEGHTWLSKSRKILTYSGTWYLDMINAYIKL